MIPSLFSICLSLLLVGIAHATDSLHVRLIGHYADSTGLGEFCSGDVRGDYACYAGHNKDFTVLSVADPAHPVLVGSCDWVDDLTGMVAVGDFVYAAGTVLHVVSVADPSRPVEVGRSDTAIAPQGLAVSGGYAYVACDSQGLRVISVSDPTRPEDVAHCDMPGIAHGVEVEGGYVYVANFLDGLRILSVADPLHPVEVGYLPGSPVSLAVDGDYAYATDAVSDNLQVISIADPANPVMVGSIAVVGEVEVAGCYAYVLQINRAMLHVVSIADPTHPVEVGHYGLEPQFWSLDADRGYVYAGSSNGYWILEFYLPGDLDVDGESLDVVADTIRLKGSGSYGRGEFVLANTSAAYNPDTADGPSLSVLDSVHFTGSLSGPGGTLDSILIPNLPASLAEGQVVICSLAVFTPPGLRGGDYSGAITIAGKDTAGFVIADTFYALVRKLGDLDVDDDSLSVLRDTVDLHAQPAGPVYSPYAKARFMLVNTSQSYNPDTADGPSESPLRELEVEAKVEAQNGAIDSIFVLNLPESLAVGEAVECTLALVVPVGTPLDGYTGWVTISATDTLGFEVRDSFAVAVRGPQPRQGLDSLRVAPIPFKPNHGLGHDAIHFQGLSKGARVIVYDASGQEVWRATEHGGGHLAWKAEVASGIYVYLVVAEDGKSKFGKLSVIR